MRRSCLPTRSALSLDPGAGRRRSCTGLPQSIITPCSIRKTNVSHSRSSRFSSRGLTPGGSYRNAGFCTTHWMYSLSKDRRSWGLGVRQVPPCEPHFANCCPYAVLIALFRGGSLAQCTLQIRVPGFKPLLCLPTCFLLLRSPRGVTSDGLRTWVSGNLVGA